MKYYAYLLLSATALGLLLAGCDLSSVGNNEVTLAGRVLDAQTNDPISEALITVSIPNVPDDASTVTDSLGNFSIDIEVDNPVDVTITATKEGALASRTERVSTELGSIADIRLKLNRGTGEDREPGRPTNIILKRQSTPVIRVKESGGQEISRITYQVVDSTGLPIDIDEAVDVSFSLGQQPGGNAKITPTSVTTDGNGEATVNVSSGTTAGVVQIFAETQTPDGKTIRSKPVRVTIHGGLPDQDHFSLGPDQFNFPGLTRFGLTNAISVIVGDKYGNPVVPGTSVYFTTDSGVIGGSVETNSDGRGSVNLTSARPLPLNGGVAVVTAETADENQNRVSDQIPVVFSGRTQVTVTPTVAQLGQTYTFTVSDVQNGNPLAPGSRITVQAEGNEVAATGNTNIELDDTAFLDQNGDGDKLDPEDIVKGDGITHFTFRVVEDPEPDNPEPSELGAITIDVNSPNGSFEIVLTPSGGAAASKTYASTVRATNDATITRDGNTAVVQAPEQK